MKRILSIFLLIIFFLSHSHIGYARTHKSFDSDVQDAVVKIVCTDSHGNPESSGSGVRIEQTLGGPWVILTADHVIGECSGSIYVAKNGDEVKFYQLKVVKEDADHDLALLETKEKFYLPYSTIALAPEAPIVGDTVYIAGYPAPATILLLTKGIVSAYTDMKDFYHRSLKRQMLVTDAPCYFGNSGGPLLNERWELVGIVHGAFSTIGYSVAYMTPHLTIIQFLNQTDYKYLIK